MSGVYPLFRQKTGEWIFGATALPTITGLYAIGVDSSYVADNAHSSLADVNPLSIVMPEIQLTGVTYVNGILDANDGVWAGLDTNDSLDAFILYLKDDLGNSYLLVYIDDSSDASIPAAIDSQDGQLIFNAIGICIL